MFEPNRVTVVVMWAVFLAILYWVVLLAARHAIRDADKRRQGPQP
jgi:hypothetical protein